jgi:hypothetical protein
MRYPITELNWRDMGTMLDNPEVEVAQGFPVFWTRWPTGQVGYWPAPPPGLKVVDAVGEEPAYFEIETAEPDLASDDDQPWDDTFTPPESWRTTLGLK